MKNSRQVWFVTAVSAGLLCAPPVLRAQATGSQSKEKPASAVQINRLTIEVTGGDSNKPVENASVYVKTVEQHTVLKDKKTELNVKTNPLGIAHIPDAPLGRVLIQIVADGWKSYGHWYDITDPKEVIKIHLERPPKWY
jgi:hypothetical protein